MPLPRDTLSASGHDGVKSWSGETEICGIMGKAGRVLGDDTEDVEAVDRRWYGLLHDSRYNQKNKGETLQPYHSFFPWLTKWEIMSMGTGKTMVVFFSLPMVLRV